MQNIAPWSICDGDPIIDPNGNSCVTRGGWQATGATRFSYDSAGNRRNNGGSYLTANRITAFAGCSYVTDRSEEHTSELQSHSDLVCRLLLEKKKNDNDRE